MSGKLHKHLRTKAGDEDAEDEMFMGEDNTLPDMGEEETPIDPRWNELKKILDNN